MSSIQDINEEIIAAAKRWADKKGWRTDNLVICTGGRASLMDRNMEAVGEEARVMCLKDNGCVIWEAGPFVAYFD